MRYFKFFVFLLLTILLIKDSVYGQCSVSDNFSGTAINTGIWNVVSGSWSQNEQITGDWSISAAQTDQGNILLVNSLQPNGDYTVSVDCIISPLGQYRNGHKFALYNSPGNKYNINYDCEAGIFSIEYRQSGSWYNSLIGLNAGAYFNTTPGQVNQAKLVRTGNHFQCFLNGHQVYEFDEAIFGGNVKIGLACYGSATYDNFCLTNGGQPPSAGNLGLLVKNISSLDAEEQAVYNFAGSRNFSITLIDPNTILNNSSILDNMNGFWAANNSTPTGFNNSTIISALRSQLESGKRMLVTWYGYYLAQYLGLGTAYIGSSWYPAVSDHEYWVDKVTDHPLFNNLTPWRPPTGPPDDETKLLWYVTPGYVPGGPTINWSVTPMPLRYAHIWASYGWCGQSPDPNLQAQYGITGTCQRGVYISSFSEVPVGNGSIIQHSPTLAGGDYWHYGQMGFELVENVLKYACTGAPPQQLPAPILAWPEDGENKCLHIPISFAWGMVSGATSYEIEFSTTENFQAIFHRATVNDISCKYLLPANMLPEQRCYWRVRACAAGICGDEYSSRSIYAWSRNTVYGRLLDAQTGNPIKWGRVEVEIFNDRDADKTATGGDARSCISYAETGGYFALCFPNVIDLYRRIWIKAEDKDEKHDTTRVVDWFVQSSNGQQRDVYLVPTDIEYINPYDIGDVAIDYDLTPTSEDKPFELNYTIPVETFGGLKKVPVYVYELSKAIKISLSKFSELGIWTAPNGFHHSIRIMDVNACESGALAFTSSWPLCCRGECRQSFSPNMGETDPRKVYAIMRSTVAHELGHAPLGFSGGSANEAKCQWTRNAVCHSDYYQEVPACGWVWYMNYFPDNVFDDPGDLWWCSLCIHGYSRTALLMEYNCQQRGSIATLTNEWNREYTVWKISNMTDIPDYIYHDFAIANVAKKATSNPKYSYAEFADQYRDMKLKHRVYIDKELSENVLPYGCLTEDLGQVYGGGSQYLVLAFQKDCANCRKKTLDVGVRWHPEQSSSRFYTNVSFLEFRNGILSAITKLANHWTAPPDANYPDSLIIVVTGIDRFHGATVGFPLVVTLEFDRQGSLSVTCPVDLKLTGPHGLFCDKDSSNVDNIVYAVSYDSAGNKSNTTIAWRDLPSGKWILKVMPDSTATPDSTFSLFFWTPTDSFYIVQNMYVADIPPSGFPFFGGPYASLSGSLVVDSSKGLLGVTVDVYDSSGTLFQSLMTDDSGYYHIDSIPNGNYTISVVTPLGYQADQETKEFTINHVPVTVNFLLTKLALTPRPRSRAYWADQLTRALQNKPQDYALKDFSRFTGLISVHFNQNQINPVDFYSVPQPASQYDSLMVLKKLLLMCIGEKEPFFKRLGKSDLMALMLNVVSGKISQTQAISADGRTVSQAITYCDMLVNDEIDCPNTIPGHGVQGCRYILADLILTLVNFGLKVPKDLIPADVVQIAYKIHNEEALPTGFTLQQNYPNPFNPKTQIDYALPKDCNVKVMIYNILGQKVMTLVDEFQTAGFKIVVWDGKDDKGQDCASGIYFYKIQAGEFSQAKKMVIVK